MNKVLVAITSIAGITAVVAPATFLVLSGAEERKWNSSAYAGTVHNKYGDIGCAKDYFWKVKWNSETVAGQLPPLISAFNSDNIEGCLAVKYTKDTFNNSKWRGNFKLVLAMSDKKQGFLTTIKARTISNKWKADASAYFMKSINEDGRRWLVTNSKDKEEEDVEKLAEWLPESLETTLTINSWNLDSKLTDICESGKCTGKASQRELKFDGQKISKGSENIDSKGWYSKLKKWIKEKLQWDLETLTTNLKVSLKMIDRFE